MDSLQHLLEKEKFLVMGVLNITEDSFYDGGRYLSVEKAVEHAFKMKEEGANIIDIGAESARPFSDGVETEVEKKRISTILNELKKSNFDLPISIDTRKSEAAECAIDLGAEIINDISGGKDDPEILNVVAKYKKYIILMHIKGTPKNMQVNPVYEDVVKEVKSSLQKSVEKAIESGIEKEKIIIDPGIGFGKNTQDNLKLIKNIDKFVSTKYPVLLGVSRKSLIGNITNAKVEERLPGTLAFNVYAFLKGVKIFRVHDVKENLQSLKCISSL